MTELVAWVLFPLLFYVLATGIGLLGVALARVELPDALLAPAGACLAVPVVLLVVELGGAGPALGLSLVAVALAGLIAGRGRLPAALTPGWPAVAGLLGFALYMGPVVLSGHWTWLGYNFVNDTASNFAVIEQIARHGTTPDGGLESTRQVVVNGAFAQGYPLGAHGLVAALEWLVPARVEAVYQPWIACQAGFAAMSFAWLARSIGVKVGWVAALVGLTAIGANLTFQYALQGSFKEIALVSVLATGAALARWVLDARLTVGAVAILAAALSAGVGVFTAGATGYAAGLAAVAVVAVLIERPKQRFPAVARAAVVAPVVLVVVVAPVLADSIHFAQKGAEVFANTNADLGVALKSPATLGHLARPLPLFQGLGSWFRQDYRFPPELGIADTLTTAALILAGLLALVAAAVELSRRRLGVLFAVVPALFVYLVATPGLEPYADAKLLVVLSPMAVFAAAVGAWWVYTRVRAVGIVAGVALVLSILVSDALAYRNAHIAPIERMEALRDAAEHGRDRGPWLFPEWEELSKHFGGETPIVASSEPYSPRSVSLRKPAIIFNHSFDLDDMTLKYVNSWDHIMLRRSPEASRPPDGFELTYRNAYYELWDRRKDAPTVLEHMPLQRTGQPAAQPVCQDVRALASRMSPGERLVAARRPLVPTLAVTNPPPYGATAPTEMPSWYRWTDDPTADAAKSPLVATNGAGTVAGKLDVPAGTYAVWVKGGGGRPLHVFVDNREVGAVRQINTPGQWLGYGRVTLDAGSHDIRLTRPARGFEPGNGVNGPIGGIALEPIVPHPLVTVSRADAESLCGHAWDWIERVSG
jgi:hypothetical protein